jgi:exodeoxyribonuclease V beta subunit
MEPFDVLKSSTDIGRNYLIEASAGTGKTFSIENIIVRLLLEKKCRIEEILVVTFTKMATRDLLVRVREKLNGIEKALQQDLTEPDYLSQFLDQKQECISIIRQSLLSFDLASIDTIHGFCSKALNENSFESDIGFDLAIDKQEVTDTLLRSIIRDFFRTRLNPENYSPYQFSLAIRDKLEDDLLKALKNSLDVFKEDDFSQSFEKFKSYCAKLNCSKEKILADGHYMAQCTGKKKGVSEGVEAFANLFSGEAITSSQFDTILEHGLVFVGALLPETLNKKFVVSHLNYPTLSEESPRLWPASGAGHSRSVTKASANEIRPATD